MGSRFTILVLLFSIFFSKINHAQTPDSSPLYVFSWDNDFMNIVGKGTDKYYSSGLKLGVSYKAQKPRLSEAPLLQFSEDTSKVYTWSITQTVFTPEDIRRNFLYPIDWPYASGLFVSHSAFSFNTEKNLALKSELSVGILGPKAFGGEAQSWFHGVIHYVRPQGWSHQVKSALILNYKIAIEPQLFSAQHVQVIGNTEVEFGTLLNDARVGATVRLGRINNYYEKEEKKRRFS